MRTDIRVIQLLDVVRRGGSVVPLTRLGLEFSQIADLLAEAKEARLVIEDELAGLALTEDGEMLLSTFRDREQRTKQRWIQPLEHLRTVQVSKETIYLPADPPD